MNATQLDRVLATTFLSPGKPTPAERTPELAELSELLERQEETSAQLGEKLEVREAERHLSV